MGVKLFQDDPPPPCKSVINPFKKQVLKFLVQGQYGGDVGNIEYLTKIMEVISLLRKLPKQTIMKTMFPTEHILVTS